MHSVFKSDGGGGRVHNVLKQVMEDVVECTVFE